jgi:molybdopterin converting factor subunit 1
MPRQIDIQYFAQLKEERGCSHEVLDTSSRNASELYKELTERHRFTIPEKILKVAINEEFSSWQTPLKDQDKIVFIPPVAGG